MMYVIINPVNRNDYLIQNTVPFNHLLKFHPLNDCAGSLDIKVFDCSLAPGPIAHTWSTLPQAQGSLLYLIQVLLMCHFLNEVNCLPDQPLFKTAILPHIRWYALFTPLFFLCLHTTYSLIYYLID